MVKPAWAYLRRLRQRHESTGDSLTAAMDNSAVDPTLLAGFRQAIGRRVEWEPAGAKDAIIFADSGRISQLADDIVALGDDGKMQYWLLRNDWSGFPDPSEFVLVGFDARGELAALGYFEDWPRAWPMDEWLRERLEYQPGET